MSVGAEGKTGMLLAVDLDGTYVAGNTLHIYFRCGLRDLWRRRRLGALARCACLLGARAARLVSHRAMKFGVFAAIEPTAELRRDFAARVGARLSEEVDREIRSYREKGYAVLLATAAPAEYVPLIWPGDFVATDMSASGNPGRVECRGGEKLRRVQEYAAARGLRLGAAISDDEQDDAPLLEAAEERILVKKVF